MSEKAKTWPSRKAGSRVDDRLPQSFGSKVYPSYAAVKSPWEKLYGYREMIHYINRYDSVVSAGIMQAYRIVLPDYIERTKYLCEASKRGQRNSFGNAEPEGANTHPFMRGSFCGALHADLEEITMFIGRVNDFGTHRIEKELDMCPWDIVGSEVCRATTYGMEQTCNYYGEKNYRKGPNLELNMVDIMGCGHRHCRIVGEDREVYPMPERERDPEVWERFGPVATADQIKFTPDEACVTEPKMFREECDYTLFTATNKEFDESACIGVANSTLGIWIILAAVRLAIEDGVIKEEDFDHALKYVFEASGKVAFGEFFAKEGLRHWLGAPEEACNDGRILGGYLEMYMQAKVVGYEIEAFNCDEVVYVVKDRNQLAIGDEKFLDALLSYWFGMSKTLINTQWALWEEDSPEGGIRIKIAKKVDYYC